MTQSGHMPERNRAPAGKWDRCPSLGRRGESGGGARARRPREIIRSNCQKASRGGYGAGGPHVHHPSPTDRGVSGRKSAAIHLWGTWIRASRRP